MTENMRTFLSNQTNVLSAVTSKPQQINAAAPSANPTTVPEYSSEIADYFLDMERVLYAERTYMEYQPEVTDKMRKILVDWLGDVIGEFKHHPETYFLAIDIIDRFLCKKHIPRSKLQLVGITAVLIAAKHEEVWPPTVNDCVVVTANTYTNSDVIDMEREIATTLHFQFTVPTIYPLACRFMDIAFLPSVSRDAVSLFLESSAHCYPLLHYLPSRIAAAAFVLGNILIFVANNRVEGGISLKQFWNYDMTLTSRGITVDELRPIIVELLQFTQKLCSSSSKLQAVRRKYLSHKYHSVASIEFPSVSQLC
ncbi:cyclin A [Strigomonas culicis]|uniref:Cyclin A n=2 Tax=Strigomonas culicis TaxID=28005 RepID=S9U9N7_9TRYP|nr:cyclin A [Strigomonas culicis]EPY27888.1 cyclin A [Strigomonas culicis]|eukprot:EPY25618.1 cyclin A [Strigomonas culicis]